jgi:hypothetical protein
MPWSIRDKSLKKVSHSSLLWADTAQSVVTGLRLEERGLVPGRDSYVVYITVSRPTLGTNRHPMQWVSENLSLGITRLGGEANGSPVPSSNVKKKLNLYPFSSTRLNGVVLKAKLYFLCYLIYITMECTLRNSHVRCYKTWIHEIIF